MTHDLSTVRFTHSEQLTSSMNPREQQSNDGPNKVTGMKKIKPKKEKATNSKYRNMNQEKYGLDQMLQNENGLLSIRRILKTQRFQQVDVQKMSES